MQCLSGVHMYIRKFGQQGVIEKLSSNVTRNAHAQFDILMGILQAHVMSFGGGAQLGGGDGDVQSVASVPHGLEQLFADADTAADAAATGQGPAPPVRVSMRDREHVPVISSGDVSSVASSHEADDDEIAAFDDELELSEFLQRRGMEWAAADGELARRQSDTGMNDDVQDADVLAGLLQGDALNVIERELFYITIPDADAFRRVRRMDLQGNNLSDCPVLSSMPQLEVRASRTFPHRQFVTIWAVPHHGQELLNQPFDVPQLAEPEHALVESQCDCRRGGAGGVCDGCVSQTEAHNLNPNVITAFLF